MSKTSYTIISNEAYYDDMGYIVENYKNSIYVSFWAFTNNDEEMLEKRNYYHSLRSLYE